MRHRIAFVFFMPVLIVHGYCSLCDQTFPASELGVFSRNSCYMPFVCMMRPKVVFPFPAERKASPNGHVGRDAVHFACVPDHRGSGL